MKLSFIGKGPCSKSLLNRAWLVKSYYTDFKIIGSSLCDDVQIIEQAVRSFHHGKEIFCGQSATALRFMALRASRKRGKHVLTGTKQLFSRPHQTLLQILNQLGIEGYFLDQSLIIQSEGWKPQGDALVISSHISSQFASAVFLNGWDLEKDLFVSLEGKVVSFPYLQMTLSFLKNLGFQVQGQFPEFKISSHQQIIKKNYEVEPDMSCLFALACFAGLKGQAVLTPWPKESLQPDYIFPFLLEKMGLKIERLDKVLKISSARILNAISTDLVSTPDIFPLLAVLCSFAKGVSVLRGVSHLKFKESDRLSLTAELIQKIGRKIEIRDDALRIEGFLERGKGESIVFDPQGDHRMVMAGALLGYAGFDVKIKDPSCVNKSFPEFWNIIGWQGDNKLLFQ